MEVVAGLGEEEREGGGEMARQRRSRVRAWAARAAGQREKLDSSARERKRQRVDRKQIKQVDNNVRPSGRLIYIITVYH
jgi:hypothetical protein